MRIGRLLPVLASGLGLSMSMWRDLGGSARPRSVLESEKSRMGQAQDINSAYLQPPIGSVMQWAANTEPNDVGWLLCDGRILESVLYPELYDLLGSTWNAGDETATQFRIPDMRGSVPVSAGTGVGLSPRVLGEAFGEEDHILSTAAMPSHSHTASGGTHHHSATQSAHQHVFFGISNSVTLFDYTRTGLGAASTIAEDNILTGLATPSITVGNTDATPTIDNTGGDGSHNNMQPSVVLNFIIRAGNPEPTPTPDLA